MLINSRVRAGTKTKKCKSGLTGLFSGVYKNPKFWATISRRCAPIGASRVKKDAIGVRVTLLPSKQILRIRVPDGVLFFVFFCTPHVGSQIYPPRPPGSTRGPATTLCDRGAARCPYQRHSAVERPTRLRTLQWAQGSTRDPRHSCADETAARKMAVSVELRERATY